MITGELKNRIDGLWEIFWTGGLTNPLDVIEQMTYLMFIHDLDDSDNLHAKESAMLGLPYESTFAGEVKIGDRIVDGSQTSGRFFMISRRRRCIPSCRRWYSRSSKICMVIKRVPMQNTCRMQSSRSQHR